MKLSDVQITDLKQYAQVYHALDDNLFIGILAACKQFVVTYTGRKLTDLDLLEDVTIAVFVLSNEMYDNRMMSVDTKNVNFVVKQILDSYSMNLL